MSEEKKHAEEPKVYAEQPGSLGTNINKAPSVAIDEEKVEAQADEKIEEDEQAAKTDALKKEDTSGEAG